MRESLRRCSGLLFALCCALLPEVCRAGGAEADSLNRHLSRLTIRADVDGAYVLIDGVPFGRTPVVIDAVQPGVHQLRLQHPDLTNWLAPVITDTIRVGHGTLSTLHYDFEHRAMILSDPFGGEVRSGDSLLGTTPLLLTAPPRQGGEPLTISRTGYQPALVGLSQANRGIVSATLSPLWRTEARPDNLLEESGRNGARSSRLFITGATTVLSGIAAAYLKTKADDRYQAYHATGDAAILSETRRLDRAAGISLALTQIGFALFTVFLLSD